MVDMKHQIAAALRSNQLTASQLAENLGENYKGVHSALTKMLENNLVEKMDDKTYVLTDLGMIEFAAEPQKIDTLPTKITPINEKAVNEIKRTVNYDATTPSHYQGKTMQVFDVLNEFLTVEANQGFYVGNVIKYVVRFRGKNGKEDLLKAREYLNKLIDSL
jgi:predicted transcriptional regulator